MFEKISKEQWAKDMQKNTFFTDELIDKAYDNIKIPTRGSSFSAGYDFYMPYDFTLGSAKKDIIMTGIRWNCEKSISSHEAVKSADCYEDALSFVFNKVLLLFARSSVAKDCGFSLTNKVGVIDMDYYMAENEGHIMILVDRKTAKTDYAFKTGDRIVQGVIMPYFVDEIDIVRNDKRTGGFGSTGQ
jgi:dUTP pyrophosphatase